MRRVSVKRSRIFQEPLQYNCKNLGTGLTNTNTKKFCLLPRGTVNEGFTVFSEENFWIQIELNG